MLSSWAPFSPSNKFPLLKAIDWQCMMLACKPSSAIPCGQAFLSCLSRFKLSTFLTLHASVIAPPSCALACLPYALQLQFPFLRSRLLLILLRFLYPFDDHGVQGTLCIPCAVCQHQDTAWMGSSMSVRSFARLGSFLSVFGIVWFGPAFSAREFSPPPCIVQSSMSWLQEGHMRTARADE